MPTNANTFNSRVTSEALEAKFREVFPSQGGAELPQDLFASGVLQPVIDFSSVAEGSVLSTNLQTAWDFATGNAEVNASTATITSTPGFWQLSVRSSLLHGTSQDAEVRISDGITTKVVWRYSGNITGGTAAPITTQDNDFVVFVRSGDTVTLVSTGTAVTANCSYRQIATVNGTLVNPLGFTFT